uniref:Uncharacterized protein n=1 Tax=Megaviridae environmental sample TaxID=1737588 RepID=A0A5J6VKX5_9VIRU|nr:MAG: hypothetical protein [Megaviridae environmental sample]
MSASRLGISKDVFSNIGSKLFSTKTLTKTIELRKATPIEEKLYKCMFHVDSKERAKKVFEEYNIAIPDSQIEKAGKIISE